MALAEAVLSDPALVSIEAPDVPLPDLVVHVDGDRDGRRGELPDRWVMTFFSAL
jgi:hypothetical protein